MTETDIAEPSTLQKEYIKKYNELVQERDVLIKTREEKNGRSVLLTALNEIDSKILEHLKNNPQIITPEFIRIQITNIQKEIEQGTIQIEQAETGNAESRIRLIKAQIDLETRRAEEGLSTASNTTATSMVDPYTRISQLQLELIQSQNAISLKKHKAKIADQEAKKQKKLLKRQLKRPRPPPHPLQVAPEFPLLLEPPQYLRQ